MSKDILEKGAIIQRDKETLPLPRIYLAVL